MKAGTRLQCLKAGSPRSGSSSVYVSCIKLWVYWAGVLVDIRLVKDEQDSVGHSLRGEPAALLHPLACRICTILHFGLYYRDIP